ncbi:MAG: hypothetical protein KC620_12775 [Myxococcales bacterium]|nr:hypothetical protein [Myxococcales bacterium]
MRPRIFALMAAIFALPSFALAVEVVPLLGVGQVEGEGTQEVQPSILVGGSLGLPLSETWSLHGQLVYQDVDFDVPDGVTADGSVIFVNAAPLARVAGGLTEAFELRLGPAVGLAWYSASASNSQSDAEVSALFLHAGVQAALFFRVTEDLRLGPFLHYAWLFPQRACFKTSGVEVCEDDPEREDQTYVSGSIALTLDL